MDLWTKVGKSLRSLEIFLKFYLEIQENMVRKWERETIKIFQNWYVWHINDDQFTYVGELEGKTVKPKSGVVVNPFDIVKRIKTGYYDFVYPQFE